MPTWPATLPQRPLADGFEETGRDGVLRTRMDAGPPKTRRRTTAGSSRMRCTFRLTTAQRATFVTFVESDLAGGALAYDWLHPVTDSPIKVQIDTDQGFVLNPIHRGRRWLLHLPLEVLP